MATKFLFLAAQLQPYLLSGIQALLQSDEVEVLVIAEEKSYYQILDLPHSKRFRLITFYKKPNKNYWQKIQNFNPDIVVCAGWMFLTYLYWSARLKKMNVKTVCAMDTQWQSTFKQKLLVSFSFVLRISFGYAWVPGIRQMNYAIKLGFLQNHILQNLYATNTNLFKSVFETRTELVQKLQSVPKKLLYVGRLEIHKLQNLLIAFRSLADNQLLGWQFTVVGDGSLRESNLLKHPSINVLGPMPQFALSQLSLDFSFFCLCSSNEPWGMVAQEFAATGMPLLISTQCGSSEMMNDENSFFCDGGSVESIVEGLKRLSVLQIEDYQLMMKKSFELATINDSKTWANELLSIV